MRQRAGKSRRKTILVIVLALCSVGSAVVVAKPSPAALPDALAAAAAVWPASATRKCDNTQLVGDLQSATTGPVLTYINRTRLAFLDAIALPQPSGYPGDADIVPTLVIQIVGMQAVGGQNWHGICVTCQAIWCCRRMPAASSASDILNSGPDAWALLCRWCGR